MKFHWSLYSDTIFFVDHIQKALSLPFSIGIASIRNRPMHLRNKFNFWCVHGLCVHGL